MKDISEYEGCGDLMPAEEFFAGVKYNVFTDDDGYGYWSDTVQVDEHNDVYPSEVVREGYVCPGWATHVLWFNK